MQKLIALTAMFVLAVSLGAAVDRHGPMKTGNFEVQIDDVEVKGWQTVTIPGISVEQGEYREGNDAKHQEKTENGKDVRIIQEKKLAGGGQHDEFDTEGATLIWETSEGDAGEYTLTIVLPDGSEKTVTIPGKSIEQDEYREGNEAPQEKKVAGQPTYDDLEMERGVKPGDTKLHDWFEDVRAGVKVKPIAGSENRVLVEPAASEGWNGVFHEEDGSNERAARKGRNPQTGKEIKIPARDEDGGQGAVVTVPIEVSELAMEGKVKFFNEEKGYASIKEKESGEEYFVHVTGGIDEIRDEDDVSFDLREGRKGMNAVDVRRTD